MANAMSPSGRKCRSIAAAAAFVWCASFAPEALAKAHCWCQAARSDCGSCAEACVVKDFGAIGEFRDLDVRKDALCQASCVNRVKAADRNDLCLGLRDHHVPLPWSGALSSCARVGATGTHRGEGASVNCQTAVVAPPAGPWKVAFFDDFKGPAGSSSPASCFSRAPTCHALYRQGPVPCPANAVENLKKLDKCRWTALTHTSWMMSGDHMNAFDAHEIRVEPERENGVLVLSAHGYRPDGARYPDPSFKVKDGKHVSDKPYLRDPPAGYDCQFGDSLDHDRCPVHSGALESADLSPDGPAGFKQAYGKWEVRAKLAYGPGAFQAAWMLPQQGSWPGAGELDIFEAYNEGNDPRQGYIGGVCLPSGARDLDPDSCKKGGGTRWYESTSSPTLSGPKSAPFWATWHVYAVEWDPAAVRFSLDGKVTNEVKHLDMVGSRRMEYQANVWQKLWPWARLDWERKLTTFLPDSPFYWILNLGIKKDGPHSYPNPAAFVPEELVIDWVRVSTR